LLVHRQAAAAEAWFGTINSESTRPCGLKTSEMVTSSGRQIVWDTAKSRRTWVNRPVLLNHRYRQATTTARCLRGPPASRTKIYGDEQCLLRAAFDHKPGRGLRRRTVALAVAKICDSVPAVIER